MSTYSWSYKTATHRQVSLKRVETEQDCPDRNGVCQIENDKTIIAFRNSSLIQDNAPVGTGIAKRLNWKAKIYVGNLNKKTNEASLAYYFSVFGDIEDVKLIRDHDTKESRGFAFITFEKIESAEKAKKWCSFNYPTLDDNSITVAHAERKTHKIKIARNEQLAKRDPSQTLFWEFKWKNSDDAQVYGPYETSLMQAWRNQGYFDGGSWVRQVLYRQVCRGEERQETKTKALEQVKDETCEASPCKKPKLVMDYSDSEDEDSAGIDVVVLNAGERSRHVVGNIQEESGNNLMVQDKEGCESSKRLEVKTGDFEDNRKSRSEVDDIQEESGNIVMVEDKEGCENNRTVVREEGEIENEQQGREEQEKYEESSEKMGGSSEDVDKENNFLENTTETLNGSARNPDSLEERNRGSSVVDIKLGEMLRNDILIPRYEGERLSKNDKKNDSNLNKAHLHRNESNPELSTIKATHVEVQCKDLRPSNNEGRETGLNEANLKPIERELAESIKERNDAVIICGDISKQSEHHTQMAEENALKESKSSEDVGPSDSERLISNNEEGNFDILQLYEARPTVLAGNDEQGEQKINDEDLPSDYSSSDDDEDIQNDTDDISTEFVAISEIDFNLYP